GAGQLVASTNGAGQTLRFTRDLLGNVTEKRGDDAVSTFAYDAVGRVVRATNSDADCVFERDPLGRVLAETCNGRTVSSTFDGLGRRVRRVTPSGAESVWEYDPNDLPLSLHTAGRTLRFAHDDAGREIERSLDTGVVLAQAWDANHQLLSQTVTAQTVTTGGSGTVRQAQVLQRRDYSYSRDGYVTEIDDMLAGLRRFDLDPVRRVTAVHGADWSERYVYDAAGNITDASWPVPAPSPPAQPNGRDGGDHAAQGGREYAGTLIRRAGRVRYEHDGQGRVTLRQQKRLSGKPRTWRYSWDADDRLTGVTTPDGRRWRYRYDPFGRRIAKQRLAGEGTGDDRGVVERVVFAWDGMLLAEQQHVSGEDPAPRVTTWDWEPGGFRPLTQSERRRSVRSGSLHGNDAGSAYGDAGRDVDEGPDDLDQEWFDARFYAIVSDLVGTPTELVDPDGELAWRARTTLWGAGPPPTGEDDVDCPLRFPGQYHDPETGAHYNVHRYYDPETARYESTDPLGLAPAPNSHTYVPNPLGWLDPFGLAPYPVGSNRTIDPSAVRFSQDSVGATFKNGNSIEETAARIQSGDIDPKDFPPIRLVERDGNLYTLDNRRLVTFQKSGMLEVPYLMATSAEEANEAWKFTNKTGGDSILIRGTGEVWRR
ncbi:RHS repeat-associated core domain-containing protein, partial [Frankia sp. Cas3]|uniref:RHS repeat-associated core domain-containing protein n=1 Tax=Frankia sp. Cas3 TaxID=3073926 RepID=UPI002AD22F5D